MAKNLTKEQKVKYRKIFRKFDTNEDDTISLEELRNVLKYFGKDPTDEQLKKIIAKVDQDGDGEIDWDEFLQVMNGKNENIIFENEDEMKLTFKKFDRNGDNFVSKEELKITMIKIGEKFTEEEIEAIFHEADTDKDGKISYKEFKEMMK